MATEPITEAMLADWESLAEKATDKPRIVARHDNYDAQLFLVARTAVLSLAVEVRRQRGMVERATVKLAQFHEDKVDLSSPFWPDKREGFPEHWRAWLENPNEEAKS